MSDIKEPEPEPITNYWELSVDKSTILSNGRTHLGDFIIAAESEIPHITGFIASLLVEGGLLHHGDPVRIDSISEDTTSQDAFFVDGDVKVWRIDLSDEVDGLAKE